MKELTQEVNETIAKALSKVMKKVTIQLTVKQIKAISIWKFWQLYLASLKVRNQKAAITQIVRQIFWKWADNLKKYSLHRLKSFIT